MDKEEKMARQNLSRMAEVFMTERNKETITGVVIGLLEKSGLRRKMAHIVRDYCSENLRTEVRRFAGLMEMKLLKHDPVRGSSWKDGDPKFLIDRIKAIVGELDQAVFDGQKVGIKAADLANHAMMLADQSGELDDV